jgi:plastocyanin
VIVGTLAHNVYQSPNPLGTVLTYSRVRFGSRRSAVSMPVVAVVVAFAVIVIVAFVVYPTIGKASSTSSTSSSSQSSSIASTITTSTTSATQTSSSSGSSSSSASSSTIASSSTTSSSTTSSSTSPALAVTSFPFVFTSQPAPPLISPGENLTYAQIWFIETSAGNTELPASGTVYVNVSVTSAPGITVTLPNNPVEVVLTPFIQTNYFTYTIVAASNVAPGNYNVNIMATYGPTTYKFTYQVQVETYVVTIDNDTFAPDNLTVPAGSTVYWINIDPTAGDQEIHDINSTAGLFISPALWPNPNFNSWSYTFNTAGKYNYVDDYTYGLIGTVFVTG